MLNEIVSEKLVVDNYFKIEIDRIFIFVESLIEVQAFRALHSHYFEYKIRNFEQGTISNIFFLRDVALELIRIENQELAIRYAAQHNFDIVARTQWRRNQAIPFGFILHYLSPQTSKSKRRYYHAKKQDIENAQGSSQINFSLENLKNLNEPACYIVPESLTAENLLDSSSVIKRRLLSHQSRISNLTDIRITLNTPESLTNTISLISALDLINIKQGKFPKLELKFNNNSKRQFSIMTFSSMPVTVYH